MATACADDGDSLLDAGARALDASGFDAAHSSSSDADAERDGSEDLSDASPRDGGATGADGDGALDGCASSGCEERSDSACANGRDDDGDGRVDCGDPDCTLDCLRPDCRVAASCRVEDCYNGFDDDLDGPADCDDSDCAHVGGCDPRAESCANDRDDDGDGALDCMDEDCQLHFACDPCLLNVPDPIAAYVPRSECIDMATAARAACVGLSGCALFGRSTADLPLEWGGLRGTTACGSTDDSEIGWRHYLCRTRATPRIPASYTEI